MLFHTFGMWTPTEKKNKTKKQRQKQRIDEESDTIDWREYWTHFEYVWCFFISKIFIQIKKNGNSSGFWGFYNSLHSVF